MQKSNPIIIFIITTVLTSHSRHSEIRRLSPIALATYLSETMFTLQGNLHPLFPSQGLAAQFCTGSCREKHGMRIRIQECESMLLSLFYTNSHVHVNESCKGMKTKVLSGSFLDLFSLDSLFLLHLFNKYLFCIFYDPSL